MSEHVKNSNTINETLISRMKALFPIYFKSIYDVPDYTIIPKLIRKRIHHQMKLGYLVSMEFDPDTNDKDDSSIISILSFEAGINHRRELVHFSEFRMSNKKLENIYIKMKKIDEITFQSNKYYLLPRLKKEAKRRSITLNDLIMTFLENELQKTYTLNVALEDNPDDRTSLLSRAQIYSDMGYYNLSLKDYDHLVNKLGDKEALQSRAEVYLIMNRIDKAKKDFKTYLKYNFKSIYVHYMLGRIYLSEGQKKHGINEMKLARKYGSKKAENYLFNQGIIRKRINGTID